MSVFRLNSKRQITLSVKQCHEMGIKPGDELDCAVIDGMVVLQKKKADKRSLPLQKT